jgi:hypothetical protein
MAREFTSEMTIYLWPTGNQHYPEGHAAFKVNHNGDKQWVNVVFNRENEDETEKLNQRIGEIKSQRTINRDERQEEREIINRLRQLGEVFSDETRNLEHTAPFKVKLPFMGSNDGWGLTLGKQGRSLTPLGELRSNSTKLQLSRWSRSSPALVGKYLEAFCGSTYVPTPCSTNFLWNTQILENWAQAIRARIDDLNAKLGHLTRPMNLLTVNTPGWFNKWRSETLMSLQEWKQLSNYYMGNSLLHSGRRKQLDDLIGQFESPLTIPDRVQLLAQILDIVSDYVAIEQSNRMFAVTALGVNVKKVVENQLEQYRDGLTPRKTFVRGGLDWSGKEWSFGKLVS